MCVLVYKCLHDAAPTYLVEMCTPVSTSVNRSHLRSTTHGDLAVPRSRTKRYGQRCFAVSGPTLWHALPPTVRDPSLTLTQFYVLLNTGKAYETLSWRLCDSLGCKDCCTNTKPSYLLPYLLMPPRRGQKVINNRPLWSTRGGHPAHSALRFTKRNRPLIKGHHINFTISVICATRINIVVLVKY